MVNWIGRRVGPFEIERLLGEGGIGQVFRAHHVDTGQLVALKVLGEHVKEVSFKRLRREVKVLQALRDPHVVSYVAADLSSRPPYLAMELISGESLFDIIERALAPPFDRGRFPLPGTLRWAIDVARGLAASHREGVLHRDLKPQNIMIDASGKAVLIDFGLARTETTDNPGLTGRKIVGTAYYLSPEHTMRQPAVPQSDVYQWGLLVHEMMFGTMPYPDLDPVASVQKRASHGVPMLAVRDSALDPLARIVWAALAVEPRARPADGNDLVRRLEAIPVQAAPAPAAIGTQPPATEVTVPRPAPAVEPGNDLTPVFERLKNYRFVRVIGEGGMGVVYEARVPASGERLAIKLIHPSMGSRPELEKRFCREIDILSSLMSPRIVRVLDHGAVGRHRYLVMEYLEGETVAQRLTRAGRVPGREAVEILRQTLEGVAALHAKGLIHRDLKPANVMLTRAGSKILDLGLAKDPSRTSITQSHEIAGTFLYQPPEVLDGAPSTCASDVFQIGLVLYEMLTARTDFRAPEAAEVLAQVLAGDEPHGGIAEAQAATRLPELFARATAPDPANRFPDARRMLEALDAVSGKAPAATAPHSPPAARPVSVDLLRTPSGPGIPLAAVVAAIVLGLVVLVVVVARLVNR